MNHLYRNPNDHLVACDYAEQVHGVAPPDANVGVWDDCEDCEGEGVFECSECGHETDCLECEGSGEVEVHPDDVEWECLNDLFDVTINDEFGVPITKSASEWASAFDRPTYVGELCHYQGES